MGLKSLKRSIRDVIINLIERVFIENIFVSSTIIFELFNINKYFMMTWIFTILFMFLKIKRGKFTDLSLIHI